MSRRVRNRRSLHSLAKPAVLLLGIELAPVGHIERIISTVGGMVAVYLLIFIERGLLGEAGAAMLVASMGASAVLLFAVPHGALSQPWAVVMGNVSSAIVGVTCARCVPDMMAAASLSVGLSIAAMHYARAIHPPGGATALTAVIGGHQVQELGYWFVVTPVLLNVSIMVAAAVVVNGAFEWRRYPAALGVARSPGTPNSLDAGDLNHSDFIAALSRLGTFVDIGEAEFLRLREFMQEAGARRSMRPDEIRRGGFYSNGVPSSAWSIREVVDAPPGNPFDEIVWRVVAGRDVNQTGASSPQDFAAWAALEVIRSQGAWTLTLPPTGTRS